MDNVQNLSSVSISSLWKESESQGAVRLLLPDSYHPLFYLKKPSNPDADAKKEERSSRQLELLINRELKNSKIMSAKRPTSINMGKVHLSPRQM